MNKIFYLMALLIVSAGFSFSQIVIPKDSAALRGVSVSILQENKDSHQPVLSSGRSMKTWQAIEVGHPMFASPHANPIAILGSKVFVVNTPADTIDVIHSKTGEICHRIPVGVDPVSIAVHPNEKEIWISNHVSDSVSILDTDPVSPTYLSVVDTIQDLDPTSKATRFDEPVGIAFADSNKAYVALSSENKIAVINTQTRKLTKHLKIPAQDPRAIVVRNKRLYVIPFESNNKSQLSGGARQDIDGNLVTFDAWEHSIRVNNVLSLGHVTDIVKHPEVPDRDLFVFDTSTDELIETVNSLGTLLYGMAVSSTGEVFITQTDARNDVNGKSGSKKHSLKELENRAFLNQITRVGFNTQKVAHTSLIELEPQLPTQPEPGEALATPYGISISEDDTTLVVTAAGSNKLFTVDVQTGKVLGKASVGAVPRGIVLEHTASGKPSVAWVYNAVANSVSQVDLSDRTQPRSKRVIQLEDPTDPRIKRGRTWFNHAAASSTGTFSCASCHPDGNTDQLLWVLKTPIVTGGNQIMPRSTMPVRGLRDTAPFHWDGIPGDPYGGNNSANVHGDSRPNSELDEPTSATLHLIDGGLATTMHLEGDNSVNDEGKVGKLSSSQRADMAAFLLSLTYPPAQRRGYDNVLSNRAESGFKLFHIEGDNDPGKPQPNVCGNCHRMPFWVSTNTPGTGMEAPTWRGAYDRFLILPQGRLNIIEFPFYRNIANRGQSEEEIWRLSWGGRPRFNPIWSMVLEGSTGFSGSFARQTTLNTQSIHSDVTLDLLKELEVSAREGAIVLEGEGTLLKKKTSKTIALQFDPRINNGVYLNKNGSRQSFTSDELVKLAANGEFIGTFTGRHGKTVESVSPQPAIWTLGPIHAQRGKQEFPILHEENQIMSISGRHFNDRASVFVDGRLVDADVKVTGNEQEKVTIELESLPAVGMHMLQVQTKAGLFSNDFIFHVVKDAKAATELKRALNSAQTARSASLQRIVAEGDIDTLKRRLNRIQRRLDDRLGEDGSTLLGTATLHNQVEIAKLLIRKGATVNATNRDGNAPLHIAAFFCRHELINLLLENSASLSVKNRQGETPIDVVAGKWDAGLAGFYRGVADATGIRISLEQIERDRPMVAKRLKDLAAEK